MRRRSLAALVLVFVACAPGDVDDASFEGFDDAFEGELVSGPDCTDADVSLDDEVRPQCSGASREARFGFETFQRFDVPRQGTYGFLRVAVRRLFSQSAGQLRVRVVEFAPGGSQDPASATEVGVASVVGSLVPRTTKVITLRFSPALELDVANAATPRYALVFDVSPGRLSVGLGCTASAGAYADGEMGMRKLSIDGAAVTAGAWRTSNRDVAFAIGDDGAAAGPCASTPGAECDDGNGSSGDGCSASCRLESGFTCEGLPTTCVDLDECTLGTDDCAADADCANTPGAFTCTCRSGFTGDGRTCTDIDECASANPCAPHGACVNTVGAYACSCDPGRLASGPTCVDVNECASSNPCAPHGDCVNADGTWDCDCEAGWTSSGGTCVDVDECACATRGASELATLPLSADPALLAYYRLEGNATDGRGTFHGTPVNVSFGTGQGRFGQGAGFVDNQSPRIRVGANASFNATTYSIVGWLRSSANGVLLGNMLYGYPRGYGVDFDADLLYHRAGNASAWTVVSAPYPHGEWIHVAATNDGTTMRLYVNGAEVGTPTASPTISWSGVGVSMGDYFDTYTAVNAYTGDMDDVAVFTRALTATEVATLAGIDGGACEATDPCGAQGACVNSPGGYACSCNTGWTFAGGTCVDVDECASTPCGAGRGTCTNTPGGYTCGCNSGYTASGGTCVDVNECLSNPCGAGSCTNTTGAYTCTCPTDQGFVQGTCRNLRVTLAFTQSGAFVPPAGVTSVEVLVVAGGGGGGTSVSSYGGGGGGGAGGRVLNTNVAVTPGQAVTVTVGNGGAAGGTNAGQYGGDGGGSAFGSVTATGGGGGAHGVGGAAGRAGGSGGGGGYNQYSTPRAGGAGVSGQGFAGGTTSATSWAGGAGGGGAGGAGQANQSNHTGGAGGVGWTYARTGVTYSVGGRGGGGTVSTKTANTGYGGDAAYANTAASAGASGVVVVSYLAPTSTYPEVTTTFTSSGTFVVPADVTSVEAFVVAGGGGGGSSINGRGGGGGAGGVRLVTNQAVTPGTNVVVTVGGGGSGGAAGAGSIGSDGAGSAFGGLTATGGGGGAHGQGNNGGRAGGSGGGAGYNFYATPQSGGSGVPGQGFAGGHTSDTGSAAGAGGGGATGAGQHNQPNHTGGMGGPGFTYARTGLDYGAGGNGGGNRTITAKPANRGWGGDAGYSTESTSAGSSGVVIVTYRMPGAT